MNSIFYYHTNCAPEGVISPIRISRSFALMLFFGEIKVVYGLSVRGKTSPDAVVTVGVNNVDVDENGSFTASVNLLEGVNVIEVLASDLTGSTKGQVLMVIYNP